MRDKPYSTADLAALLGMSLDTFYQRRGRLHADDGLPAPLTRHRPYKWHRPSIDAWLARFHPHHAIAAAPANDAAAPPPPASDEQWRAHLAQRNRARLGGAEAAPLRRSPARIPQATP